MGVKMGEGGRRNIREAVSMGDRLNGGMPHGRLGPVHPDGKVSPLGVAGKQSGSGVAQSEPIPVGAGSD